MSKHLHIIITGGTIDSRFDAANDMIVVNDSSTILKYIDDMVRPHFKVTQEVVTMKDSREIDDAVRSDILKSIESAPSSHVLVTHGTYTMPDTARFLNYNISDKSKTVVLTGSMFPLQGFAPSDAPFNLGFAIATAFLASPGICVAMNGKVFPADDVIKNVDAGRFVSSK